MNKKIEIRCRNGHCNRLFMNYYVTGNNVDLNLGGFELKCEKCKRVLRLKNYTEQILVEHSVNGVFRNGYDMMTTLGSDLEFSSQRASVSGTEFVEIVGQNFGFDVENGITEVELDLSVPHYYIEVRKVKE